MTESCSPVQGHDDFEVFLARLRDALHRGLEPGEVSWERSAQTSLLDEADSAPAAIDAAAERARPVLRLPRGFIELLRVAMLHEGADRFHAAHTLAVAILQDRRAWSDVLRGDRLQLERMAREVRREIHKMHAFVRFRPMNDDDGECFVAWFEPTHRIVRAAAPFFVDRFAAMRWAILTPQESVHWDRRELRFGPAARRADAPGPDGGEALWIEYYRSIFNPARANLTMMRREMPVRFWRNLPEAAQISSLLREAQSRATDMQSQVTPPRERRAGQRGCGQDDPALLQAPAGDGPTERLAVLARRAAGCEACPFSADATQTVWGEGAAHAALMLVGEQPGDQEDLAGRPFVGPAGQLLRRAIAQLGWPADQIYLTNAVKHFKYEWRGKRRIHKTAAQREALACADWLEAEIDAVRPRALVALGRTALTSLMGRPLSIEEHAGQWLRRRVDGLPVYVMPHPAAVLRAGDADSGTREAEWTRLLAGAGQALRADGD
ncbi:UdgX family uracil-DNA binding protein [Variovorax dokdonensis]|uniref:Type-4 uracil-DNA glycosylase n=1 Tax=Variovorax dokdonensis TaxID=344883 RepID=A0ABT7NDF1_9BURK|nr:UdgX family uracil-DNA binding protein [Variovorax dokdonensis]MDM0045977.1 UdgX family uracil-DNA binding protein [Variovorax dokdonensis]